MTDADPGHDVYHVQRVVANAIRLGTTEKARPEIVLPAAWLHDCVIVRKDSPNRHQASRLAAEKGQQFLWSIDYPAEWLEDIAHAVLAHSFTASIPPETLEAQVVQDADRLEALGALGLARCLMTGGTLGQRLFDPIEPFPVHRLPDERRQSLDHFYTKLLRLPETMQTRSGRVEADHRRRVLVRFLNDLAAELGTPVENVNSSLAFLNNHLHPDPCNKTAPEIL